MKKIIIFILLILSISIFGKEIEEEYISILKANIDILNKESELKKKFGFAKTNPEFYYETQSEYLEFQSLVFDNVVDEQIAGIKKNILG